MKASSGPQVPFRLLASPPSHRGRFWCLPTGAKVTNLCLVALTTEMYLVFPYSWPDERFLRSLMASSSPHVPFRILVSSPCHRGRFRGHPTGPKLTNFCLVASAPITQVCIKLFSPKGEAMILDRHLFLPNYLSVEPMISICFPRSRIRLTPYAAFCLGSPRDDWVG